MPMLADQFFDKCKKEEPFTGSSCYKKFTTLLYMEKHTNVFHTIKQEVLACESSRYITKHKSNLTRHVKKVHTESKK